MAEKPQQQQGDQMPPEQPPAAAGGREQQRPPGQPERRQLPAPFTIEIWDNMPFQGAHLKSEGIESTDPGLPGRNRSAIFQPEKLRLRGRWSRACMTPDESSEHLTGLPAEIYGQRIEIDPRRRMGRIFDPLALPENKALFERVLAVIKSFDNTKYGPAAEQKFEKMSDSRVKTWVWWMYQMVQARIAKVVDGELPKLEEIERMPGKRRIQNFNNSAPDPKYPIPRYVEDIPRDEALLDY